MKKVFSKTCILREYRVRGKYRYAVFELKEPLPESLIGKKAIARIELYIDEEPPKEKPSLAKIREAIEIIEEAMTYFNIVADDYVELKRRQIAPSIGKRRRNINIEEYVPEEITKLRDALTRAKEILQTCLKDL